MALLSIRYWRAPARQTGYLIVAERPLDPTACPGADPRLLVPGSAVFHKKPGPVDPSNSCNCWVYVPGACWSRPAGPSSTVQRRSATPWCTSPTRTPRRICRLGREQLPTQAEWDFAARGGLYGAVLAWGNEHFPDRRALANTWKGDFPWQTSTSTATRAPRPSAAGSPRHTRDGLVRRVSRSRWPRPNGGWGTLGEQSPAGQANPSI